MIDRQTDRQMHARFGHKVLLEGVGLPKVRKQLVDQRLSSPPAGGTSAAMPVHSLPGQVSYGVPMHDICFED